jgi:hypothetical protein
MKFKMVATAELSLTLDPTGKMFQNASSLKPLGQLSMSCGGGHLGFPISIKNRNLVKDIPMIIHLQFGFSQFIKNVSKCFFSETTWTIETKLPRNDHWKVLYQVTVFYADRKSKMVATAGHRLTLDPMGKSFFP